MNCLLGSDEWGSYGRARPTILDLWELCAELDMRRACDYIAVHILGRGEQESYTEGNLEAFR